MAAVLHEEEDVIMFKGNAVVFNEVLMFDVHEGHELQNFIDRRRVVVLDLVLLVAESFFLPISIHPAFVS